MRYEQRSQIAMHYHQSYQVRSIRRTKPSFLLQRARSDKALIHLFDEPQFNTQDGYIGFMLDFFRRLRDEGRVVFVCLHPNEPFHIELMREICERFVFVRNGKSVSRRDIGRNGGQRAVPGLPRAPRSAGLIRAGGRQIIDERRDLPTVHHLPATSQILRRCTQIFLTRPLVWRQGSGYAVDGKAGSHVGDHTSESDSACFNCPARNWT